MKIQLQRKLKLNTQLVPILDDDICRDDLNDGLDGDDDL